MARRKLNDKDERDVALSWLCHISPDYIKERWNVSSDMVYRNIIRDRSHAWNDQLVELYREINSAKSNRYKNTVHLYLAFKGQADGLPNVDLVDKTRDADVYDAIANDIFTPRTMRLTHEDTRLFDIINAESERYLTREQRLLERIFGEPKKQIIWI